MKKIVYKIIGIIIFVIIFRFLIISGNFNPVGLDAIVSVVKEFLSTDDGKQTIENLKEATLTTFDDINQFIKDKNISIDTSNLSDIQKCQLLYVVDGDTLYVNYEGKEQYVRLIGIDTPESVNPDESKNTDAGKKAFNFTKNYFKNKDTIYLQFDKKQYDDYGRLLAYVWKKDDVGVKNPLDIYTKMYNAILLEKGYARVMTVQPNDTFSTYFLVFESAAKANGTGFWGTGIFS